jgi:MSHA biogenesis protein MshQ
MIGHAQAGQRAHRPRRSPRSAALGLLALALLASPPLLAASYTTQVATYNWINPATHTLLNTWDNTLGCVDSAGDDSLSKSLALGFNFNFGGTVYNAVRVNTNGRLQFGNTYCTYGTAGTGPPRTYPDGYASANLKATMKIYQGDLDNSAAGGGKIYYATVGSAPNRQFVVTWQNVPQWSAAGTSYNLQIQVSEDGSFYYMYGTSVNVSGGTNLGPAEIGWEVTTTDFTLVQTGLPANLSGWHFVPTGSTSSFLVSNSAYGLYCLPQAVTVTARDASNNPVNTYSGTITLSTSTARGTWTLSSGGGTLVDSTPDDGLATYAFPGNQSSATFALSYRAGPATVTVHAAQASPTVINDDGTQSAIVFSPSGFTVTSAPFSNPAGGVPPFASPQTAGNNFSVYLTAYGQTPTDATCGIITGYAGAKSLKFWSGYVNPATGTLTPTINGTTIASLEASASAQSVTFTSGQATVTAKYKDAGSLAVSMKDDTTGNPSLPTGIRGSTGTIVSVPANFVVSNIKRTSDSFANPGSSTATGTVFATAGQSFTATVTAVEAGGAATPNFGRESAPESVAFNTTLVLPAVGHAPAVSGTAGSFTNGVATGSAFAWLEAGIMKLVPHVADGDYLGAGDIAGTATGNVGRFVPNSFAVGLNTPLFGTGCTAGSFTYLGQPITFTVPPIITVTAQAFGGATTQNYTGSLMRMTNTSLTGRTYTPTPASPALDSSGLPATTADPLIADLGNGQVTLTFGAGTGLAYVRGNAIAPFNANIALSINVIDLDAITAANPVTFGTGTGIGFSSGAGQRYGRMVLRNTVGSELLDLPASLTTEYYLSATLGFTTNTSDSCTVAPTLAFSFYQANLSAGETCVRDSGNPGASGIGCTTAAGASVRYRASALGGDFNLWLAAPGSGNNGAVTVTAAAPAWLKYLWSASSGVPSNPAAMATFGLFPGPSSRIYQREVY